MTNWKKLIEEVAEDDVIIYCTLSDVELVEDFDEDYGCTEGKPFTAWSKDYVYFPVKYDGREWVERVPRNPCDIATKHVGGGNG